MIARHGQRAAWKVLQLLVTTVLIAPPAVVRADVAAWDEPTLDRWFHQGSSTAGLKTDPSLFADFGPGAGLPFGR